MDHGSTTKNFKFTISFKVSVSVGSSCQIGNILTYQSWSRLVFQRKYFAIESESENYNGSARSYSRRRTRITGLIVQALAYVFANIHASTKAESLRFCRGLLFRLTFVQQPLAGGMSSPETFLCNEYVMKLFVRGRSYGGGLARLGDMGWIFERHVIFSHLICQKLSTQCNVFI